MTAPALAVDGLTYAYPGQPLFEGFAIRLERGEQALLLGASGSGKTTLVNLIAGLLTPDAGTIAIDGEPMTGVSATHRDDLRRRRIGVVFQTLRLVSALSVRDNLRLAQRLAGNGDASTVDDLLGTLGLRHRADARPRALSQGEAQRAAIARALVGRPALVIADEPTSALDDANAERVARMLLDTVAATGAALLIATHDARLKAHIPRSIALAPARIAA